MGARLTKAIQQVRACTLCQLETRLGSCLPAALWAKSSGGANSRERTYTPKRTFWCFVWQCLHVHASGREVVRQLQALLALEGAAPVSSEDGAYCAARQRLPETLFARALTATAQACDHLAQPTGFLQGRAVKLVDGTALTLAESPQNQAQYPQVSTMKKGCAFPLMKVVAVFSLLSGAIVAAGCGPINVSEFRLLYDLAACLSPNDIVIADRGFGNGSVLAWLQSLKIDFIARSNRHVDGRRRHRRLGKNDWLITWKRKPASAVVPQELFDQLASEFEVRIVRGSLHQRGFRVRQITVVTTLLDPQLYPAAEILRAYLRRWRLEMCLDDLKTTLGMNVLSCKSPAMVRKEMLTHLIAHNLLRYAMIEAAVQYGAELERISFKGTLDALRQFTQAMAQARSKRKRNELWDCLQRTLASDLLPFRPNRREPRAIKLRSQKYDRLTTPRHKYKDRPKRNERRRRSHLRLTLCVN